MKTSLMALALACSLATPLVASAQENVTPFEKAEDAIKYRQSALTLTGSYFGRMAPVMRGRAPYDAEAIKADVAVLKTLSALPWQGFGPGTEGGNARPEVWSDNANFQQAAKNYQDSVTQLVAAADSGDFDRVRAAYGETANTCQACHKAFRQRR